MEAALLCREAKHSKFRHCMKHQLEVAVVDAFRQPCGSRGIERGRLDVLVEVIELEVRGSSSKQFFVFANELKFAGHGRLAVGEDDQPFDLRQLR